MAFTAISLHLQKATGEQRTMMDLSAFNQLVSLTKLRMETSLGHVIH